MYCSNCGNKVDENAYICVNCGVILKKNSINNNHVNVKKDKKESSATGIISIITGSIGLLFCLWGFVFGDISSVGMYTSMFERFFFALGYNFFQLIFAIISLILSLIHKNNKYNKVGLVLTLITWFLIVTEFVVILIY